MIRYAAFCLLVLGLAGCGAEPKDPAPKTAGAAAPAVGDYDAVGTEPFWAVQIRADSLTLSRPDHPDLKVAAPTPEKRGGGLVWSTDRMTVSVIPGACSDGMSDRGYVYEALVRAGSEILKGCAYRPGAAPSAAPAS